MNKSQFNPVEDSEDNVDIDVDALTKIKAEGIIIDLDMKII